MGSSNLISKIAAGGLSAGIFLIWWPGHVGGEGLSQLVVRGLLWTLSFELLLLAFQPLESLITRRVRERLAGRRDRVRQRLEAAPKPARTGGVFALASVGLLVPLLMISDPGTPKAEPAREKPRVIKQVIVKRPVVKREVVVRPEVVDRSAVNAQAPAAAPAPETRTVVKRVVVEREKVVEKKVPVPAKATPAPTQATTTPAAAPTPAAQPATEQQP
jgi:hypothetical protein